MRALREWLVRLRDTIRPGRRDADLEQELRAHLELAAEDARRSGGDAAARAARLAAGGAPQAMETLRDQRSLPWVTDMTRDIRHGLRMLRRSPGYTIVALVTLALGIGANTAIFSIVNAVLLRPLVYPRPDQLVRLTAGAALSGTAAPGLSSPEYEEFRAMNRSFSHVGAFTTGRSNTGGGSGSWTGEVNLTAGGRALRVRSAAVDHHLLGALGVQPAHGRLFAPGETDAMASRPGVGGPPIAILSHELWHSAFGGEPLVGRTVDVDGRPHEIIGILPPGVDLVDTRPEIWLPIGIHPAIRQIRTSHMLSVIGRLRDGVTWEAAAVELDLFLEDWADRAGVKGHVPTSAPTRPEDHALELQPLQEAIVGDASRAIWLLQAAVALVLLIGCANLANLAIARAESRRREFAVRSALGAGRGRLIRQAVVEGLLLSVTGGLLGVWLAHAGVQALLAAYPTSLPRTSQIAVDRTALAVGLAASIGTGLFVGLIAVARGRDGDLVTGLRTGGDRGASPGRRGLSRALVTAEVALAMMLVTSAGLLLRTVHNLTAVDAGFDRSRLVTFSMTVPRSATNAAERAQVYQRLLDTLRAAPGVQAATAMSDLPLDRVTQRFPTRVGGDAGATAPPLEIVDYYQFVMSGYFRTMGIPLVAGRDFDRTDMASAERVVIVNETLANRLWSGRNPVGQRLRPNLSAAMGTAANPWHTVIGVARDVKEGGVDRDAGSELYLFLEQPSPPVDGTEAPWQANAPPTLHVVMQTSLRPAALSDMLERTVAEAAPSVPVVRLRDMDAVFAESIRQPRLLAHLLSGFAGLSLLLASVGTYGVLSWMVTSRRREIGIRMALGAARASVMALVMTQGLQATFVGIVIGVAGALLVNQLLAALLFGVTPTDAMTMLTVVATIALASAAACWLPAWRASRLDPNLVIRAD